MAAGPRARLRERGTAGALLAELADKYEALATLGAGQPGRTLVRRDAMRAIASRFPAALREWDEAPAGAIAARQAEVEALLETAADAPDEAAVAALLVAAPGWLRHGAALHPLLRDVLAVKRWLAGQGKRGERSAGGRVVTPALADAFTAWRALHPGWVGIELLPEVLAPPGGHVAELAFLEVARRHGVSVADVKHALFDHEP